LHVLHNTVYVRKTYASNKFDNKNIKARRRGVETLWPSVLRLLLLNMMFRRT